MYIRDNILGSHYYYICDIFTGKGENAVQSNAEAKALTHRGI